MPAQCAGSWLQFPGVARYPDSFPLLGLLSSDASPRYQCGPSSALSHAISQLGPELQITLARGEGGRSRYRRLWSVALLGYSFGSTLPRPAPPPTVIVEEPVERVVVQRRPVPWCGSGKGGASSVH